MMGVDSWHTKFSLLLLSTILCVTCAEVTARVFWRISYDVLFRDPGRILYAYYPDLKKIDRKNPDLDDEFYDILLLGGSVLSREWGQIEQCLSEQLAFNTKRKVRIFNLSKPAHTSRDNRLKYSALGAARFEMVVLYHGINEVRANNVPPELFREDYTHFYWYKIVNTLASYHEKTSFALP